MELSETQKAYIAGIVDGEGSIMLTQIHKNQQHAPVVSVSSTDRELLDWLKDITTKGSISLKPAKKENHKDSWDWKISYNAALELLELILPYLKIERKIYRALLLVNEYKDLTPRNGKYTPDMVASKQEFLRRFHNLEIEDELIEKTRSLQLEKIAMGKALGFTS